MTKNKNFEMGLKWMQLDIDEKMFRQYRLDYGKSNSAGGMTLNSIMEFQAKSNTNRCIPPCLMAEQEFDSIDMDHFIDDQWDYKIVNLFCYYTYDLSSGGTKIPVSAKHRFNSENWAFQQFDFTGSDGNEIMSQYHYDWLNNRAVLEFKAIIPVYLTPLMTILIRYYDSFFHLMTELGIYRQKNGAGMRVRQENQTRKFLWFN